jgi:hypothetical protein
MAGVRRVGATVGPRRDVMRRCVPACYTDQRRLCCRVENVELALKIP